MTVPAFPLLKQSWAELTGNDSKGLQLFWVTLDFFHSSFSKRLSGTIVVMSSTGEIALDMCHFCPYDLTGKKR